MRGLLFYMVYMLLVPGLVPAQRYSPVDWHGQQRVLRYRPEGGDFTIVNGSRRFNRALYGTHTAFRVEAGDLPEFALYMPGMGGNMRFGIIRGNNSQWLIQSKYIKASYRPGSMLYEITDPLLGEGVLHLTVLALADAEGMIVRVSASGVDPATRLLVAYGGATGKKFSRDGDIGADPESSFYLQPEYCKGNRFTISGNGWQLSYGGDAGLASAGDGGRPRKESAKLEGIFPSGMRLRLADAEKQGTPLELLGSASADVVGPDTAMKSTGSAGAGAMSTGTTRELVGSAGAQAVSSGTPMNSPGSGGAGSASLGTPLVMGELSFADSSPRYFYLVDPGSLRGAKNSAERDGNAASDATHQDSLALWFDRAEGVRRELAERVQINTPDSFINAVGGALSVAADAIWEDPSYLHGAVAWRMRLNAWRGPYAADPLGWHDRARRHFSSYALSQMVSPDSGPVVADTALHLARGLEKLGTSLFSSGYISRNPGGDIRPHHYDMNLVFIDELLEHFYWTGDTAFVRKMWPVIQRHLAWEKRNFDPDDDGLYDAYCCIWASDALEYNGGGVTHSSSYNYRANSVAADLAVLIGEDPTPYRKEAEKILHAINTKLWMPDKGWYAEYIDWDHAAPKEEVSKAVDDAGFANKVLAGPLTKADEGLAPVDAGFSGPLTKADEVLGNAASSSGASPLLHPAAALWTIYHAIDSRVPDPFQAWQSLKYIDNEIHQIPIRAEGLEDTSFLFTLPTTNWQPYSWSINNVAMAESLHTALAYWQGGRPEAAWPLWKGAIIESMYLGASPGNFQQLSFYDAVRGELYRDFADPIGMAARSLVEGLFGIHPDVLHDTLTIQPGWPANWDHASLHVPDIKLDYIQRGLRENYKIIPEFSGKMNLQLKLRARSDSVVSLKINGQAADWTNVDEAVGNPVIRVVANPATSYDIEIEWSPTPLDLILGQSLSRVEGEELWVGGRHARAVAFYDPQHMLTDPTIEGDKLSGHVNKGPGRKSLFVQVRAGRLSWWEPFSVQVMNAVTIQTRPDVAIRTGARGLKGHLVVDYDAASHSIPIVIRPEDMIQKIRFSDGQLQPGLNHLQFKGDSGEVAEATFTDWKIPKLAGVRYETIDLSHWYNDAVTQIFKNSYLAPRPTSPTLQLPTQGIGNWCYPLVTAPIDDVGLRKLAGSRNEILLPDGIPLATPGTGARKATPVTGEIGAMPGTGEGTGQGGSSSNIIFTSRWSNYPDSMAIPLHGKASHAYFLLAGTTNPMQSQITNGTIEVYYKDGSVDELELKNPTNWWPIEQDYYEDGYAFRYGPARPIRVYLKTGRIRMGTGERDMDGIRYGDWIGNESGHFGGGDDRGIFDQSSGMGKGLEQTVGGRRNRAVRRMDDKPAERITIKGFSNMGIDGGAAEVLDMPLHSGKELDRIVVRTVARDVVIGMMSLTLSRSK